MKWRVNGFYLSHDGDDFAATVSTMGLDQWIAFTGTGKDREQAPDYFDSAQQAMRWCEDQLRGEEQT